MNIKGKNASIIKNTSFLFRRSVKTKLVNNRKNIDIEDIAYDKNKFVSIILKELRLIINSNFD